MLCSMSRTGDCYDNAVPESFFATLEQELVQRNSWQNHEQAKLAVFDYIETFYNRSRIHTTIDGFSPMEMRN